MMDFGDVLRIMDFRFHMEPVVTRKPMESVGLPATCKHGAKPCTYRPAPNGPPRSGSKRRRQWR